MANLRCPHCNEPVAANPLGRWFAHFQCPHCRKMLRFDARTNAVGVTGSALFFIMAWALLGERSEYANAVAWGAGAFWLASMGLTYALRRLVKG